MLPLREEAVHQFDEVGVVGRFQKVGHLVDYEVFEAVPGLLREVGVQTDRPCPVVAAAPLGLHALNEDALHFHSHQPLPFGDKRRDREAQLVPVPRIEVPFHPGLIPTGTPAEDQLAVAEFDGRGAFSFDDFE